GDYRAVMTFKIAGDGRINGARLLGTTGSPGRDEKILRALEGLSLDSPAPPDLAQPIMMVILPRASGTSLECTTAR
ncbi:TonB C-terminal domain-containing protein, partial [Streptomyces scabiei]|uniref:TonB C-terminal domain-containing protein n=1 Tax=Streptomyces scabiei TaxID=1930 RepID=UPI0038F74DA8